MNIRQAKKVLFGRTFVRHLRSWHQARHRYLRWRRLDLDFHRMRAADPGGWDAFEGMEQDD